MPFDSSQHGEADPALAPATSARPPLRRGPKPLLGGVEWRVAVVALLIAATSIAGLAWKLQQTQEQGRDYLDDAIQRRTGLTAEVIASAFTTSRSPAATPAEFGGRGAALDEAVKAFSVAAKGQRITVLDADGRVLAAAGRGRDLRPSTRPDVQRALRGAPALSDAFSAGREGVVVELAVPFPSASGRRVLLTTAPVAVVQSFTKGFFATQSAFPATHGYLLDGAGETLSSNRPRGERLDRGVRQAVARGEVIHNGGRTYVSGRVPSSRWTVVLSVPTAVLYASVDGAPARGAWLVFAAFVAAVGALLGLLLLAARSARHLAAANRSATAASELAHERLHDPLTGLANRALFAAGAERALEAARRRDRFVAVVFLDIDHYKLINDSLGHDVGDEVLQEIARRLLRSVRGADTVSRFGGDEFVVLCDDLPTAPAALPAVERIRAGLDGPVEIGDRSVPVTFSIGVATSGGERTAGDLLAEADAAMYRAKELGRDRVEIFDSALKRHALIRLDTEVALRQAVKHGELRLQYQPIVDLHSNTACGVEALVRWCRPGTDAPIQPTAFIGIAEDMGVIGAIGEWVLATAVAEVGDWVARGLVRPEFVLSVNVAARQLADPEFPQQVAAALAQWERPADRLWLEITETAVMFDTGACERGLDALHALGVGLALDDFGAGYSSLGKLARTLPISILKLDSSFVFRMADRRDHEIVAAAAALANALDLSSVAEGVESAEQARAVTGVGFRYAQGFYFGTPADADETVRRLGGGRFTTRRSQWVPG